MVLSKQEYQQYLGVHLSLLYYCFCKKNKFTKGLSFDQFVKKQMDVKFEARNFINQNSSLLNEFLDENGHMGDSDKELLLGFNIT